MGDGVYQKGNGGEKNQEPKSQDPNKSQALNFKIKIPMYDNFNFLI